MVPKSIQISSKRPPRTDLENDSKNTSKLVPLDPQELSSRCSGSSILTKSAGSEKSLKIAPKWKPKWYQNRCEMVSRGFPKSYQKKGTQKQRKCVPKGPPRTPHIPINVTSFWLFSRFCVKMAPWKVWNCTWTSLGLYFGHILNIF